MNKDLTVGKPQTVLWQFCLPLLGSILFQQLYNIADSLVAGKFIGENALAAVGNAYEITLIFIALAATSVARSSSRATSARAATATCARLSPRRSSPWACSAPCSSARGCCCSRRCCA